MAGRTSTPAAATRAVDDFRRLLAPGAIRAVFQPIVRLADLQPIGYEDLARFPTPPGLLALLAGQAAGSLRMAAAVTELRERAARTR